MAINFNAVLNTHDLQKTYTYNDVKLLDLDMTYPEISLHDAPYAENRINVYYKNVAAHFDQNASTQLRKDAMDGYAYTLKNNFPFHAYDAVMKYTVTLNADCLLSTYIDQYQYTGGAHGNTLRSASNWNLQNGAMLHLGDLFKGNPKYKQPLTEQILKLAEAQMLQNEHIYFEDYKALILKYFNPNNFYLTPIGIAIFFQQYEIGPYASGIIVFEMPYHELGIKKPGCKF